MTHALSNSEVAATFRTLADLLSIRGDSAYKVNAYRRAAESIAALSESLAAVRRRGDLTQISGVGKEIAQKIGALLDTGTFPLLQQIEHEIPRGVAELLAVPGSRAKACSGPVPDTGDRQPGGTPRGCRSRPPGYRGRRTRGGTYRDLAGRTAVTR